MKPRLLIAAWLAFASLAQANSFDKDKLVAWCIVPFDAKQRGPAARAKMLVSLGLKRVAYDWRERHIKEFEEEILQYKNHGLEYFAFWGAHKEAFRLFAKHMIHPQIWITAPSPQSESREGRLAAAAKALTPLVKRTRQLGSKLGLYNHGGWGGEPINLVALCEHLRTHQDARHVGIVYNFHHGHEHITDFEKSLKLMQPHLLCINLNGMNDDAHPKIVPLGQGRHEADMLRIIHNSGYKGPIGILDHRSDTDSEIALRENLEGIQKLLKQIDSREALDSYQD